MDDKQNAQLDLISKKAASLKKKKKEPPLTAAQLKAKTQREFAERLKRQAEELKAKEAEAKRLANRKPPPEPYTYSVPDPRVLPFPKIAVIRPEDRQELVPIAEVLEAKRVKELTGSEPFKQFELNLNLDPLIERSFAELDAPLAEIGKKFQTGEGQEPAKRKLVPAGKQISIAQVIKSRALLVRDFELYERAPLLAEDEAIRVLSEFTAADPTFPYEYSRELG